jgi:hypothetical protein
MQRKGIAAFLAMVVGVVIASSGGSASASIPSNEQLVDKALKVVPPVESLEGIQVDVVIDGDMSTSATSDGHTARLTPVDPASTVVRERSDGFQMFGVLHEGETGATYVVSLPEGVSLVQAGAGYALMKKSDNAVLVLGAIEAPYAIDSAGKTVPTSYSLSGNNLIQTIDTSQGVTYPVVADPKLTFGAGIYLNITGLEIKAFSTAVAAAGGAAIIAGCSDISDKIPVSVTRVIKLMCTAVGGLTVKQVYNSIVALWKSGKVVTTACYQTKIYPQNNKWVTVAAHNCI